MNVTNRKDALRDQRAKMLAAAPDWRASDARVNPRVAIGSIIAMWLIYFLITTGLAMLTGAPEQWSYAGRRAIVVVAGILCTFVLYQLLQRAQPQSFGARLAAALGAAIPLVVVYATINLFVFFYWFPAPDTAKIIEEVQSKFPVAWEMVLILDSSIRWYFFFAVWAALYVAFGYANEMRAVERRANHFRLEAQTAQLRALHYQVNPHFLFNTLNSLSSLVLTGKTAAAERMIQTMATFYRRSLAADPTGDVPLSEEFDLQRLYLDIETARFPKRLEARFELPDTLAEAMIPGMILQPLVENSVKHAVAPSSGKVTVVISAREEYGRLVVTVADDGANRKRSTEPRPGFGIGLGNVQQRLAARFGDEASVVSGPTSDGYATHVRLPLIGEKRAAA